MKRWSFLLFPLVAVLLVGAASVAPSSEPDAPSASQIEVVESTYGCPSGGSLTVATGQLRAGEKRTTRTGAEAGDVATSDPRQWTTQRSSAGAVIVTERGREAGPVAFFAGTAADSAGGGLVVGRCPALIDDAWFAGLGAGSGQSSSITLINLAGEPAVADVRLWGVDGPIEAPRSSGIALEPYAVTRLSIADLAAGEDVLGVEVERQRGQLAAIAGDNRQGEVSGTETIDAVDGPSRDQVLAGVAGEPGGRTLTVVNPGRQTARVDVAVVGSRGTAAVKSLQDVEVKAGTVRQVDLPDAGRDTTQALRVTSDRPVVATAMSRGSDEDYLVAAAARPLDGPAVVPIQVGRGLGIPRLALTSLRGAASATVTAYDADMKSLGSTKVEVASGTTTSTDVGKIADGAAYLVVAPTGRLVGAAVYRDGPRISSLGLRPAPVRVDAPAVRRAG